MDNPTENTAPVSEPVVVEPLPLPAEEQLPLPGIEPIAALPTDESMPEPGKLGVFHPAHVVLDEIDIAAAFVEQEVGQRIRTLLAKVRQLL